ncbi:deoxyribose-phosphate aldolase [Inediibacterium massiliense]|uniref:deoxyribose-phosphate aldolase n=1 Tax=Inediibacterium massiliense TaxID=1658111 RepID=UPI0006B5EDD5|nr:deoxyribose-phosphate aldolase [Inediibacterium massiliense]
MNLASMIDHTLLKPDATKENIHKICEEAKEYHFASVCVNSCFTEYVAHELKGTSIGVTTVIGFPLGAVAPKGKAFEASLAIELGATEIDMVINIGALKEKKYDFVYNDIKGVVDAVNHKALVKVILENCLLTKEEIVTACEISKKAGAHFVKTSTGFSTGGATIEDVALMKKTVGDSMGVKASGGIRTQEDVLKMIEAGATRIGASASVAILKNEMTNTNY